jgi:DNA-binding CsgD family transcriptional regulator
MGVLPHEPSRHKEQRMPSKLLAVSVIRRIHRGQTMATACFTAPSIVHACYIGIETVNFFRQEVPHFPSRLSENIAQAMDIIFVEIIVQREFIYGFRHALWPILVSPIIENIKGHVDQKGSSYITVLESNLREIVSPFIRNLSAKYYNLTSRELQIANLIREGKSTKELAQLLNVSESVINIHRYRMRKKMNLTKKHNLQSFLSSLS